MSDNETMHHAPLPWKYARETFSLRDSLGRSILTGRSLCLSPEEAHATMEFIRTAVNSHAQLLLACKASQDAENHYRKCEACDQITGDLCDDCIDRMHLAENLRRTAIALGESEQP